MYIYISEFKENVPTGSSPMLRTKGGMRSPDGVLGGGRELDT